MKVKFNFLGAGVSRTERRRRWYGRGKNPRFRMTLGAVFGGWKVVGIGHEGFQPAVDLIKI